MAEYNNIYELLVTNRSDMVGRIAYSLYKEEKIEWIKKFKEDNKRKPTDEEIESQFHVAQRQKGCIERYKMQAERILQEFTDKALKKTTSQIENECRKELKELIEKLPEKETYKARYLHGILQSILGSIILAAVIWFMVVIVSKYSIGNLEIEFKNKTEHIEKIDPVQKTP